MRFGVVYQATTDILVVRVRIMITVVSALFEHRIVDGLPIVKRQFSRETLGRRGPSRTAADPTEILFDRFNPSGVARERERERERGKKGREGKYVSKGYEHEEAKKNLYI